METNQAQRRIDLDFVLVHETASTSEAPKPFIYQPLDPDRHADSIRLVSINTHTKDDDLLSCNLTHVKFAEKPRYNALSYMSGDEAVKVDILLEGALFQDVEERNRQLQMMKWIYFRADTVVTWLGKKYSKYQTPTDPQLKQDVVTQAPNNSPTISEITLESGETSSPVTSEQEEATPTSETSAAMCFEYGEEAIDKTRRERAMVTELRSDGYWDRLWIIQEICRARQSMVCFGSSAMDWNAFIKWITLHNNNCDGPLKLDRLVQEKYTGNFTLQALLQDHREASCKEPRDKIYGLIGLTSDASQFPMDYNKSLLEVWTDTMVFMNARGLLRESDIIPFGALVKSLLIGNNPGTLGKVLTPYAPQPSPTSIIEDKKSAEVFKFRAVIVGCILGIGPPTDEIISSLCKADDWADEIQQNFRNELGAAHRENDKLMRSILDFDETRLESMCFGHVSNVRWHDYLHQWADIYRATILAMQRKYASKSNPKDQSALDDFRHAAPSSPKPLLVVNRTRKKTPWKIGMASSLAQPGDLICWIPGIGRALILRASFNKLGGIHLQCFGTALFTDDFDPVDEARHADRLKKFSQDEILK